MRKRQPERLAFPVFGQVQVRSSTRTSQRNRPSDRRSNRMPRMRRHPRPLGLPQQPMSSSSFFSSMRLKFRFDISTKFSWRWHFRLHPQTSYAYDRLHARDGCFSGGKARVQNRLLQGNATSQNADRTITLHVFHTGHVATGLTSWTHIEPCQQDAQTEDDDDQPEAPGKRHRQVGSIC